MIGPNVGGACPACGGPWSDAYPHTCGQPYQTMSPTISEHGKVTTGTTTLRTCADCGALYEWAQGHVCPPPKTRTIEDRLDAIETLLIKIESRQRGHGDMLARLAKAYLRDGE